MNDNRYSKLLLWLFPTAFLSYLAYRIFLVFSIQPDLGGVENAVVYFIQRSLADLPLYTDPELPPYSINQYGPLYYLLTASIGKLLGVDPAQVQQVFILNRFVSLGLNLVMAATLTFTCTRPFSMSLARGASVGILGFIFLEITSYARPDSLNHLLYFLSILFFLLAHQKNKNSLLIASALFAAAALFTKQSSFTLPLIIGTWMVMKKQFKPWWFTAYGIFFILALVMMNLAWGFPVLYGNLVMGVNNGINLGLFWANIIKPFFASFGLLLIPAGFLVFRKSKKENQPLLQFLALAMVIQFFISLALSLKFGSHINYFTESWTLLLMAAGYYWKDHRNFHEPSFPSLVLAMILVVKILFISFPLYREIRFGNADKKNLYEKEKLVASKILSGDPEQKVFNNLFSPHSFLNNFFFRQAVLPQYEIVYFTSWDRKVYDYKNFREQLSNGNIAWMITKNQDEPTFKDFKIPGFEPLVDTAGYRILKFTGNGIK